MPMRFRNYGGINQFVVADEGDLARIGELDAARWAATSAPLGDLHCDPAFLACLDPQATGRIRVSQLVSARDWLFERLARRDRLASRSDTLRLDDLDARNEAGPKLRAAAERLLRETGQANASELPLGALRDFRASYCKLLANGDGVVPPALVPEPETAAAMTDVLTVVGGRKDASGEDGIGVAELERFVAQGQAWLAWRAQEGEAAPKLVEGKSVQAAALGGVEAGPGAALITALDGKIEEYFWHCELLRHEEAAPLRLKEDELRSLAAKDAAAIEKYLAGTPLATPRADGTLPLDEAINPVYREQFASLRRAVLAPVLGNATRLTRSEWHRAKAVFAPFFAWEKNKPAEPFEQLGEARVRALLDEQLRARIAHFIGLDEAAAGELQQLQDLEQLVLYQRWLVELTNNFVNFSAIYQPEKQALVEMGSMVIDGRRLDFCVKVADRAAHKKVAAESLIYLVYADILAKDSDAAAYQVAAPVTAGERGRLRVGKRGLFIDNDGKEWDAVVAEIVEQPISVKEAAFAPFRKAAQFVSKKIEDWVGAQQSASEKKLMDSADKAVTETQQGAEKLAEGQAAATAAPAGDKKKLDVNSLILGGGLALAGLGAVLAGIFAALTSLKGWLAIGGIVLAVMALSGLMGWFKLRRRDMSLLLEASGWAVNVRMKVNRHIGRVFTRTPPLPRDAKIERVRLAIDDEEQGHAARWIVLALLALFAVGAAGGYWYFRMRPHAVAPAASTTTESAPAAPPAVPPAP